MFDENIVILNCLFFVLSTNFLCSPVASEFGNEGVQYQYFIGVNFKGPSTSKYYSATLSLYKFNISATTYKISGLSHLK